MQFRELWADLANFESRRALRRWDCASAFTLFHSSGSITVEGFTMTEAHVFEHVGDRSQ